MRLLSPLNNNPETLEHWARLLRSKAALFFLTVLVCRAASVPTAESKHDVAAPAAAKVAAPRLPLSTSVPVYQTAASEVASVTSHSYTAPSAAPCPIDERGRPRCPGDHAREAISLKDRGSELAEAAQEFGAAVIRTAVKGAKKTARYRLGRTGAALFALVSALLAQLATLLIEDAIVKTALAWPLPPAFSTRATTLSKRVSRAHFRATHTLARFWQQALALACVCAFLVFLGRECAWAGVNDDVPFARFLCEGVSDKTKAAPSAYRFGRSTRAALRIVVLLELVACVLTLLQPLKHVLPRSLFPRTVSLRQPHNPSARIETSWLYSETLALALGAATILQTVVIGSWLKSFSPMSLGVHLAFMSVHGRMTSMRETLTQMRRTVACLDLVARWFATEQTDSDWVCTICFEGDADGDEEEEDAKKVDITRKRCRLQCSHVYHAKCLLHWLHFQSFCPVCHQTISTPDKARHAPEQPPREHVYPGNLRRRPAAAPAPA